MTDSGRKRIYDAIYCKCQVHDVDKLLEENKRLREAIEWVEQVGRDWFVDGQIEKFHAVEYLSAELRRRAKEGK